jgi:heat shock protein HslJ
MFGTHPRGAARRVLVAAFALVVLALVVGACSSSGSGLTGKTWQLTAITEKVPAFQGVVPAADQPNYTITFATDGKFNAKADCNMVSGTYTTSGSNGIAITVGPSTLVACPEGSFSSQYIAGLSAAQTYAISGSQLTLTLKDEGTLTFTAAT